MYPNVFSFLHISLCRETHTHPSCVLSLFLPKEFHQFLSVYVSVCLSACVCACVFIIAKSPSSMMGSKWPTVVHSKQQRLAALEDRVLSERRKTFLSLLMYL